MSCALITLKKVLFSRDVENKQYELGGELAKNEVHDKLKGYADDIRDDTSILFLSVMNQNKKNLYQTYESAKILQEVFMWFGNRFDINYPNQRYQITHICQKRIKLAKYVESFLHLEPELRISVW